MHTILVVDDDPGVRALLRRMIESLGHAVLEAGDALAALGVLDTTAVSLALVDVRMPGRDGVWLVDQIVNRYPKTPIALATGLLEMDPAVTLRPGVVGYIVKPFNRSAIADVINAALDRTPPPRTGDIDLSFFDTL